MIERREMTFLECFRWVTVERDRLDPCFGMGSLGNGGTLVKLGRIDAKSRRWKGVCSHRFASTEVLDHV